MGERFQGIGLAILTALLTAVILVPTFVVIKVLMDLGLGVLLAAVVVFGLLLAYLLRRETVGG
jgi:hypothetical protein